MELGIPGSQYSVGLEERHNKPFGVVWLVMSLVWLGVYAHYLNSVTVDCCAIRLKDDPFWQPEQCDNLSSLDVVDYKNVSKELHALSAWAVALLTFSTV